MSKLLFIRYKKEVAIPEGGEQVTKKNYRAFCQLLGDENVIVYNIHDEIKQQNFVEKLLIFIRFLQGYYYGLNKTKITEIVRLSESVDTVFIDRSVFGIIAKKLKKSGFKGRIMTFFHNVETVYFSVKIPRLAPWRPFVLRTINMNDKYSACYSDVTLAITRRDAQILKGQYKKEIDFVLPVTFEDQYQTPTSVSPISKPPICMFLGAYFPANVRGIKWFMDNVYPHVDVRMQIVGKGMEQFRSELSDDNIELYSDVPDLMPFIENADFMVLPIFEGSGMKVKVCEALMYGKNIIATDEAFAGYELEFDKVGALCNTKEEFIDAIRKLSADRNLSKFNSYSREVFLEKYEHKIALELLKNILIR